MSHYTNDGRVSHSAHHLVSYAPGGGGTCHITTRVHGNGPHSVMTPGVKNNTEMILVPQDITGSIRVL